MKNHYKVSRSAALAVLLAFFPGIATAQNSTEKPTPPFVAAVPDFCQWTITIEDQETQPKPLASPVATRNETGRAANPSKVPSPSTVQKVVCTKTKDITRDVLFYDDGKSTEVWYYRQLVILRSPGGGGVSIDNVGGFIAVRTVPEIASNGFVGVDWITAANFQMKTKLSNGRDAFVYRGDATGAQPRQIPTTSDAISPVPRKISGPVEAMIDVETRFPLLLKLATRTLAYSYQAPPTEMLVLPADAQSRVSEIQARQTFIDQMKAFSQHPSPPPEQE